MAEKIGKNYVIYGVQWEGEGPKHFVMTCYMSRGGTKLGKNVLRNLSITPYNLYLREFI